MKLSIIIVSFNTADLLEKCVESIYKYPPKVEFEIIVVDNNSSDQSVLIINKLRKKYSNLKLIKNTNNLGFAKANNQGIAKAKGDFVLLLNSDTQVTKNAIQNLYDFGSGKESIGAVVPQLLNSDGSIQSSAYYFPTLLNTFQGYWMGQKRLVEKYSPPASNISTVDVAVMAAFLITPKCLQTVGILDNRYFMYYEDFDYCRRIKEKGLKVYYVPTAKVFHEHGASGKNIVDFDKQWKRMIPSAKIYHGTIGYYLRWLISRSSQLIGITK